MLLGLVLAGCGGDDGAAPGAVRSGPMGYERSAPLEVRVERRRSVGSVSAEALAYAGAGGDRVPALVASPSAGRTRACLVYLNTLTTPRRNGEVARAIAANLRTAVLTIDVRGHGQRATAPGGETAAAEPQALRDLVRGSAVDVRRGIDLLQARHRCQGRIGLVGTSAGGAIGAAVAGVDGRVTAAALLSVPGGWDAFLRATDAALPGVAWSPSRVAEAIELLHPYDPGRWVGRIAPRPLLVLHGDGDRVVSPDAFRDLRAAVPDSTSVVEYAGGHDPFQGRSANSNQGAVADFLRRELLGVSRVPPA